MSGRFGTPHDSLNGTQATMHGWLWSRSIAAVHSRVTRSTESVVKRYALGISSQTSRPSTSAQYR